MAFPVVDADAVYLCTGDPMPRDIEEVVRLLFNSGFNDAFQSELQGGRRAWPSSWGEGRFLNPDFNGALKLLGSIHGRSILTHSSHT